MIRQNNGDGLSSFHFFLDIHYLLDLGVKLAHKLIRVPIRYARFDSLEFLVGVHVGDFAGRVSQMLELVGQLFFSPVRHAFGHNYLPSNICGRTDIGFMSAVQKRRNS